MLHPWSPGTTNSKALEESVLPGLPFFPGWKQKWELFLVLPHFGKSHTHPGHHPGSGTSLGAEKMSNSKAPTAFP